MEILGSIEIDKKRKTLSFLFAKRQTQKTDNTGIKICGIDPGMVNMSTWIGTFFPDTHKIRTAVLSKCACGDFVDSSERSTSSVDPPPKKQSVQAASADSAIKIADACARENVEAVVVETAPQWNMPVRLSAATIYGVLRGRGIPNIKFSSPCTKAKAVELFAEHLGISDQLEKHPEGANKLDKKISAKIRLINKRNAVRVVEKLLEFSNDEKGLQAMKTDPEKKDDMADAILLGCGTAFSIQAQRVKFAKRRIKKPKK